MGERQRVEVSLEPATWKLEEIRKGG